MPIASGAAGRVDVRVGASTARTADELKRKNKPANGNCDSYLQRYQELKEKKKNKINLFRDNTNPSDNENDGEKNDGEKNDGAKDESTQKNDSREEDHTSGKLPSGDRPKKSQLCVLL